jgi:hypothetical protein
LRSEFAFRKNYSESHTNLNSICGSNNSLINNLINFIEIEYLTQTEMKEYQDMNRFSYIIKKEKQIKEKSLKLPCKLKTYFVNGKIMTEEEYHSFRDSTI